MVRACRPPAREPTRSWLWRRSTMATSTLANASSAANISPVGPPPAITTECFVMPLTVRHDPGLAARSGSGMSWKWRGTGAALVARANPKTPVYSRCWIESEGAVGGLRGELRVVRHLEPVDEPD